MIVVDVGCARYGSEFSIERLIERYAPDVLYGFDPAPRLEETDRLEGAMRLVLERKAAWLYDGEIGFVEGGLRSHVDEDSSLAQVPCFDLARFVNELPEDEIILKLDCEGAEIPLLEHLNETGADVRLSLVLVEWHCETCGTGSGQHTADCELPAIPKVGGLRCPITEWVL